MKKLLALFVLSAAAVFAQNTPSSKPAPDEFPGIKSLMSPEDFERAGLSALNSQQLGLIDAAVIRHYTRTVAVAASQQAARIVQDTTVERKRSFLETFGLSNRFTEDWRDIPSLKAHCTGWAGGNAFKLDNGQVWEGFDQINVEVKDRDIEIAARPAGQFALIVDGTNTKLRVHRIK
ncbi:MAG: hypothetical protein JWM32_1905 [Verrucomicrobia bacterium]|nr:hypothetical protein [Verrucomicrobiota bacterium]